MEPQRGKKRNRTRNEKPISTEDPVQDGVRKASPEGGRQSAASVTCETQSYIRCSRVDTLSGKRSAYLALLSRFSSYRVCLETDLTPQFKHGISADRAMYGVSSGNFKITLVVWSLGIALVDFAAIASLTL